MRWKWRWLAVATLQPEAIAVAATVRSWAPTSRLRAASCAQMRAWTRAATRSNGSIALCCTGFARGGWRASRAPRRQLQWALAFVPGDCHGPAERGCPDPGGLRRRGLHGCAAGGHDGDLERGEHGALPGEDDITAPVRRKRHRVCGQRGSRSERCIRVEGDVEPVPGDPANHAAAANGD